MASDLGQNELDHASLITTVTRLRDEVDGLRRAMRSRGLIEQAKGMLMERYGCDSEAAFARLRTLSEHANIKLAEVAAGLVESGTRTHRRAAGPADAPPTPATVQLAQQSSTAHWPRRPAVEDGFSSCLRSHSKRARIRMELLSAQSARDVLASLVSSALAERPPLAAALGILDANGVIHSVATHGIPAAPAARWQSFPIDLDLHCCSAVRTGQASWLANSQLMPSAADEPELAELSDAELGFGIPPDWARAALLPLNDPQGCVGVLALTWPSGFRLGIAERAELTNLGTAATVVLRRLRAVGEASADQTGQLTPRPALAALALLDATLVSLILCRPILGADGRLVDLNIVHATPATRDPVGRGSADLTGWRFLELFPYAATDGLLAHCREVITRGQEIDLAAHPWQVSRRTAHRTQICQIRITRYRDGVLITWQDAQSPTSPAGSDQNHEN